MTDPFAFVAACLALLATPGPTNTLLATSGAAAGMRKSLMLVPVELAGYFLNILLIALVVAPLANSSPMISVVLRLASGAYLIWSAVHLWREGSDILASSKPVSMRRVFTTTLLNPKGVVFAIAIIPHLGARRFAEAAPYLMSLAAMIIVVAIAWASAGALLGRGVRERVGTGLIRKVGAGLLGLFGVLLSTSVIPVAN